MTQSEVLQDLEHTCMTHPGLRHPLWDWLKEGSFTINQLRDFARFYYQHVKVYRQYLAGAMTIMPQEDLQIALAGIIADEFGLETSQSKAEEVCSHPELFRRFMHSTGLKESDWEKTSIPGGIKYFQEVHYCLFRSGLVDETVGAIVFACENATPYRHSRASEGIRRFSKQTGLQIDDQFFASHVTLDVHHAESLINPIRPWLEIPARVEGIRRGILISCEARKVFLDDLSRLLGVPRIPSRE